MNIGYYPIKKKEILEIIKMAAKKDPVNALRTE